MTARGLSYALAVLLTLGLGPTTSTKAETLGPAEAPPDRTFCLSNPAHCEGDYMLERDRAALREWISRERGEQARASTPLIQAPARDPADGIRPPLGEARKYTDFCLTSPAACSGNFVLDRQRLEMREVQSRNALSRERSLYRFRNAP